MNGLAGPEERILGEREMEREAAEDERFRWVWYVACGDMLGGGLC